MNKGDVLNRCGKMPKSAESRFAWIVQFTRAIRNVTFGGSPCQDLYKSSPWLFVLAH